jgi:PKHD-type hydroxylase
MFTLFIDNFLTNEECESLIQLGISSGLQKMTSSKFVNGIYTESNINETTNKRMGCYLINDTLKLPLIQKISSNTIHTLNDLKIFNGLTYSHIPKYSFNQYSKNDFLDWHSDLHEIAYGASITIIFQLNDSYDGGDIKYIIDDKEYSVPKKIGSIFIFDSNISHSVDKLTDGVRYSLNVWPGSILKKSII